MDGSHCAIKPGRGVAKSRRRVWNLPNVGAENNLHSRSRCAGSSLPLERNNEWSHSNADLFTYSNAERYYIPNGDTKWHAKSHGDSKYYCNSDGNTERNSNRDR